MGDGDRVPPDAEQNVVNTSEPKEYSDEPVNATPPDSGQRSKVSVAGLIVAGIGLGLLIAVVLSLSLPRKNVEPKGSVSSSQTRAMPDKPQLWDSPPASGEFGNSPVGTISTTTQRFNYNDAFSTEAIHDIAIIGDDDHSFNLKHNCPHILALGAACIIDVFFTPKLERRYDAKLVIRRDDSLGKNRAVILAKLSGTGTEAKQESNNTLSVPADTPPTGSESETQHSNSPRNCYDSGIKSIFRKTSEARTQFALETSDKIQGALGPDSIYASAAGEDNKVLLFVAMPENAAMLKQLAEQLLSNPSTQANFCYQGFAEVQFLTRDSNYHQKLMRRFETNAPETLKFIQQRGGATPIK
jgi:hypothetical protein